MASKKIWHAKKGTNNCILVNPGVVSDHDTCFEFDEADVWNNDVNNSASVSQFDQVKKILPRKASGAGRNNTPATCASSLPVNIPDWSKIYRVDSSNLDDQESEHDDGDEDVGDDDGRIPIHEYLARRRGASFSVHEGIGRTLKGRDLRQVRNAIWKTVGFED